MTPLDTWPRAPESGMPLYVDIELSEKTKTALEERGWKIVDTRIMPNTNDSERADAWRAFMEGVRVGSIEPDKIKLRFLELEGKALGLLGAKGAPREAKKASLENKDIAQLLNFSSSFAFRDR